MAGHQSKRIGVFTTSTWLFHEIKRLMPAGLEGIVHVSDLEKAPSDIFLALIDARWGDGARLLTDKLAEKPVFKVLIDEEKNIGDEMLTALNQGLIDDFLLKPLRSIDLLGKIKHANYFAHMHELKDVGATVKSLIAKFEDDLRVARGIQRSLIPEKFPQVQGLKVKHKYLSGLKSGGDYLDFFQFEDQTHVGILMSDSTGYGLSSAFMSVMLSLAVKLSKDEANSPSSTILKIFDELSLTMKPKESLSIFYGILNRKTFELRFANCGNIRFFHQKDASQAAERGDLGLRELADCSEPLTKEKKPTLADSMVMLEPQDRVVVCSDGFVECFASSQALKNTVAASKAEDSIELINHFTYQLKKDFESDDDMPAQDCSVMVIDVEKRAMRLAR